MSETTETEATPAAEPTPTPASAPESTPETEEQEQSQEAAREKEDRRVASLRARLGAAERERERQAVELEFLRRQAAQHAPAEETPEMRAQRERAEIRAEVEHQIRTERFHSEGQTQFADWDQKCKDLVSMGADPGFAQLLVEMPDGVKVAGALANDPTEVQRIANIRSERGRAIALGKYAATLESEPRAVAERTVSRAPAPIRPVTGRAAPQVNEYSMNEQQLVDLYMKQNLERQRQRQR
jgi:hypothetical protein